KNAGKVDPKKGLERNVEETLENNILQIMGSMLDSAVSGNSRGSSPWWYVHLLLRPSNSGMLSPKSGVKVLDNTPSKGPAMDSPSMISLPAHSPPVEQTSGDQADRSTAVPENAAMPSVLFHNAAFSYHFYAAHCARDDEDTNDVTAAEDTNVSVCPRPQLIERWKNTLLNLTEVDNEDMDFLSFWRAIDRAGDIEDTSGDVILDGIRIFRDRVLDACQASRPEVDGVKAGDVAAIVSDVKKRCDNEEAANYWDNVLAAIPDDPAQLLTTGEISDAIYMFLRDYIEEQKSTHADASSSNASTPMLSERRRRRRSGGRGSTPPSGALVHSLSQKALRTHEQQMLMRMSIPGAMQDMGWQRNITESLEKQERQTQELALTITQLKEAIEKDNVPPPPLPAEGVDRPACWWRCLRSVLYGGDAKSCSLAPDACFQQ
ncbi:26S proteasome non-ATPase regulatory subunit 14, partial [Perkinsus olseni]